MNIQSPLIFIVVFLITSSLSDNVCKSTLTNTHTHTHTHTHTNTHKHAISVFILIYYLYSIFPAIPVIIIISNSIVTALEGSNSTQLSCSIQTVSSPPAIDYYWYKNGQQLFDNKKYDIRFENNKLNLIIYNVNESDEGLYTCYINDTIIPATANASISFIVITCKSHDRCSNFCTFNNFNLHHEQMYSHNIDKISTNS